METKRRLIVKIGYGTYGMKTEDVFELLPRLRTIGYEAVEINVSEDWPTAPEKLTLGNRVKIVESLKAAEFPSPVLMCPLKVCVQGDDRPSMLRQFNEACKLANDLNYGDGPGIVVSVIGGTKGTWDEAKELICECLTEVADRAAENNAIFAVEPHVGHIFDTPEKAVWVMEQTNHDHLKLNFDISHFHVDGIDLQHSIDLCVPHSVATHIKDGRRVDGKVQFLLPGEGDLDLVGFFKGCAAAGLDVPVTVEVSAQIFRREGYEPWGAAEVCFKALEKARDEAGV